MCEGGRAPMAHFFLQVTIVIDLCPYAIRMPKKEEARCTYLKHQTLVPMLLLLLCFAPACEFCGIIVSPRETILSKSLLASSKKDAPNLTRASGGGGKGGDVLKR